MATPDPRRGDEPDLDADVFPTGDTTQPQPDDEQPPPPSGEAPAEGDERGTAS